VKKDSIYFST